jgi:hypothetical protein
MEYNALLGTLMAAIAVATAAIYTYDSSEAAGEQVVTQYEQVMSDYMSQLDALLADVRD